MEMTPLQTLNKIINAILNQSNLNVTLTYETLTSNKLKRGEHVFVFDFVIVTKTSNDGFCEL